MFKGYSKGPTGPVPIEDERFQIGKVTYRELQECESYIGINLDDYQSPKELDIAMQSIPNDPDISCESYVFP